MSAGGGILEDVVGLAEESEGGPLLTLPDNVVRGGDGRIYFVPASDERPHVHAIAPTGLTEHVFRLDQMPRNRRLVELKAAGRRLAATYYDDQSKENRARLWIAVYDVGLGERQSVYGPVSGMPFCYDVVDHQDRFTILKDGKYFVKLSPS
jgi:hypothetical protein